MIFHIKLFTVVDNKLLLKSSETILIDRDFEWRHESIPDDCIIEVFCNHKKRFYKKMVNQSVIDTRLFTYKNVCYVEKRTYKLSNEKQMHISSKNHIRRYDNFPSSYCQYNCSNTEKELLLYQNLYKVYHDPLLGSYFVELYYDDHEEVCYMSSILDRLDDHLIEYFVKKSKYLNEQKLLVEDDVFQDGYGLWTRKLGSRYKQECEKKKIFVKVYKNKIQLLDEDQLSL